LYTVRRLTQKANTATTLPEQCKSNGNGRATSTMVPMEAARLSAPRQHREPQQQGLCNRIAPATTTQTAKTLIAAVKSNGDHNEDANIDSESEGDRRR